MKSIDELIDDIEKLDEARRRAHTLQQEAIDALNGTAYLPRPRRDTERTTWEKNAQRDGWRLPGDDVEKAMMLQVLLKLAAKGEDRGSYQGQSCVQIRDDLLAIRSEDCYKTRITNPEEALDNVPIMRCAMVLQALIKDGRGLSLAALACFHRIVLELNEVVGPNWSCGAARASTDAMASAFITGECALALLALEDAMHHTAKLAELIGHENNRIATLRSDVPVWYEQEETFRASTFYASLTVIWPHLAFNFPEEFLDRLRLLREDRINAPDAFASIVRDLEKTLASALDSVPTSTDILPPDTPVAPIGIASAVAEIVMDGMGSAARNTARLVMTKLIESLRDSSPPEVVGSARAARNLRAAAQVVHNLFEPIVRFAEYTIDRELARPQLGLAVDVAELVFAACLLGRLSDWRQPKAKSAFQIASQLLTSNGRLLSLQPFNVQSQGYRLNVTTIETTRRLAELAAHVAIELQPTFVETLMRPFEDTRAPGRPDDRNRGWMTDPRGRTPQSEWWVTALAVDALGMVTEMLDAEINRQVLQQFHVRRPIEIDLDLGQLFYPDYGLSALRSDRSGWDRTIAVKLQQLRIHAGLGPPEEKPRYSIVLYGPPGTGKTTLVEGLAKSADVPLVEITPSDILVGGEEAIERRTRHVFLALSKLTNAVILFDEFDPILQARAKGDGDERPRSIFQFLTPGMLPKLKQLHDSAKNYRVSYILATNFVYNLDPAAIRQGRFDDQHGIYPPDAVSRLGRLLDQIKRQKVPEMRLDNTSELRLLQAVKETGGGAMDQIAKPGWFSVGKFPKGFPSGSLFSYIQTTQYPIDQVQHEAKFDQQWQEFVERRAEKRPTNIRKLMSDQEKCYWDDWATIDYWDAELGKRIDESGASVETIGRFLAEWVRSRHAKNAEPPTPK